MSYRRERQRQVDHHVARSADVGNPDLGKRTLIEAELGHVQRRAGERAPTPPRGPIDTSIWDVLDNAEFPAGGTAAAFRGLAQSVGAVQRRRAAAYESAQHHDGADEGAAVHRAAAHGVSGSSGSLPFLEQIQRSFGAHDVTNVKAHTDAAATAGANAMGAEAYATGDHVVFAGAPTLHTAAHEAAHTVQQRAGIHLKGGIGAVGDVYEQHADAVADRVVQGKSAEDLLDAVAPRSVSGMARREHVQRKPGDGATATADPLKDLGGLALRRIALLPQKVDLGAQPPNQDVYLDIARLTVRDGFTGTGEVTGRAFLEEFGGGKVESPHFRLSPMLVGTGSPGDDMLRVRFRSTRPGFHEAKLDAEVLWSDGARTPLYTTLVTRVLNAGGPAVAPRRPEEPHHEGEAGPVHAAPEHETTHAGRAPAPKWDLARPDRIELEDVPVGRVSVATAHVLINHLAHRRGGRPAPRGGGGVWAKGWGGPGG
ncbi:MAG: DUF4157 domain-containing protein, partial [Deltaproteobacteria bacterium]|nr:DUF4157 domain-containing protein [Deltaproteobacteria bacterium]